MGFKDWFKNSFVPDVDDTLDDVHARGLNVPRSISAAEEIAVYGPGAIPMRQVDSNGTYTADPR